MFNDTTMVVMVRCARTMRQRARPQLKYRVTAATAALRAAQSGTERARELKDSLQLVKTPVLQTIYGTQ
jgi:hypothetical protein